MGVQSWHRAKAEEKGTPKSALDQVPTKWLLWTAWWWPDSGPHWPWPGEGRAPISLMCHYPMQNGVGGIICWHTFIYFACKRFCTEFQHNSRDRSHINSPVALRKTYRNVYMHLREASGAQLTHFGHNQFPQGLALDTYHPIEGVICPTPPGGRE